MQFLCPTLFTVRVSSILLRCMQHSKELNIDPHFIRLINSDLIYVSLSVQLFFHLNCISKFSKYFNEIYFCPRTKTIGNELDQTILTAVPLITICDEHGLVWKLVTFYNLFSPKISEKLIASLLNEYEKFGLGGFSFWTALRITVLSYDNKIYCFGFVIQIATNYNLIL